MNSNKITCVLFDMDNTLIDWRAADSNWHELERKHMRHVYDFLEAQDRTPNGSFEHVTTHYRGRVVDGWAEARTTLRAPHMATILQAALENFGVTFDDGFTIEAVLKAYNWRGMGGVTVFPDVPDALQTLLDSGIKIGILTNAFQPMWMRDAELELYDLLKYFPEQVTRMSAADLGYLKPSPNVFKKALQNMGTSSAETIYIGDNLVADIGGAQSVGMRAVLRDIEENRSLARELIVPDAVIKSLDDLLPLVADWEKHATRNIK